jgi:putative transposase
MKKGGHGGPPLQKIQNATSSFRIGLPVFVGAGPCAYTSLCIELQMIKEGRTRPAKRWRVRPYEPDKILTKNLRWVKPCGHRGPSLQAAHMIPEIHGRRSFRLKGWDYASPGWYFVTLCVQNRESMFGKIANNEFILNEAGRMIEKIWLEIPSHYPGTTLDEFVIMPNHVHGIVGLHVGAGPRACPSGALGAIAKHENGRTQGSVPTKNRISLPNVIRPFKTLTTKKYSEGVLRGDWPEFQKRLWQRNYYEHIIRNDKEMDQIRRYIRDNPAAWAQDEENPVKVV